MKASSTFSLDENSTKTTLCGEFRLITSKNPPPFFWCPRLMFSVPQHPVFSVGCNQRNTQAWTPDLNDSFCKTDVERLPVNSSSRHNRKSTSNLKSHCLPMP
ncbi:hypothetical protein TNCV_680481 [Trichonephila clavipes]|nr:hypothetical protein TNCV_680481 [Trichonephila clavipes]